MENTHADRTTRNLMLAGTSFLLFLAVCIFMSDGAFQDNRGISFFGAHWGTVVPYILSFLLCEFFLLRAADLMTRFHHQPLPMLAQLTRMLVLLLLLVLLTPDSINSFFAVAHIVASFLLFCFEFCMSLWLALVWMRDGIARLLLGAEFACGLGAMFSEFHLLFYLGMSSLLFQIFFGTLFVRAADKLTHQPATPTDLEPSAASHPLRPR